ncbi:hypothetical protein PLIIFM63780_002242 [Purpureocillium lilacinum]|nr:hypothetical protein PLIIFM63780_002242 [Purpureocillium lilacinum]
MSARLQRLEGMVRNMMEEGGDPGAPGEVAGETPPVKGTSRIHLDPRPVSTASLRFLLCLHIYLILSQLVLSH